MIHLTDNQFVRFNKGNIFVTISFYKKCLNFVRILNIDPAENIYLLLQTKIYK